ncbi:unnamed protein product [Lepeophtheirus salmonis]|uniref:(salmon louse) hypothetical protein n=1 Tax=Lepeophtheirus salmonis TaxID=72036 RepID=A0A7R8HFI5_LEPSM|nr:unnamed protein product [Lepeophtheirus salmonis]CAF3045186.1 unnamed protein product [Lepeophtheirus salmonis]
MINVELKDAINIGEVLVVVKDDFVIRTAEGKIKRTKRKCERFKVPTKGKGWRHFQEVAVSANEYCFQDGRLKGISNGKFMIKVHSRLGAATRWRGNFTQTTKNPFRGNITFVAKSFGNSVCL